MKNFLSVIGIFAVSTFSSFIIAQSNNWADYGLTLDDVKYLSAQEKQEILNSPTPEQTMQNKVAALKKEMQQQTLTPEQMTQLKDLEAQQALHPLTPEQTTQLAALKKITLSNTQLPSASSGGSQEGTTQEPNALTTVSNTTNCFNYYTFGSVEADISAQSSSAVAGMTMGFFGNIKNNNPYPIVAGTLYVKIMKNVGGEKNANGPDIVDQFIALDNIIIPANGSMPAQFTWQVPAFAETGDYQVATYFLSDKKFNLLGLSFTDDVVGNSFRFTVKGEKTGVMFDKSSVIINEKPYYFAAYPPRIALDKNANISLKIKNTTNTAQSAQVQWKLYKWDSMGPDNLIREFTTTTDLKPKTFTSLSFIIPEKEAPVYYLVGELTYQDTKSIVNIRFVRDGVDKVRLNFPSIMKYPITANEPITLFTCLHNSGQSAQVQNNKVILELKNETGKVIESYIYEGIVTGEMMAVKKDFIAKKTLDTFSVHAALYTDNKLVDESTMKYDCTLLDPTKCPTKTGTDGKTPIQTTKISQNMFMNILLSLLALIVLIILIVKTKNKKTTLLPLVLLLLIPLCILQPTVVEAKDVIWTSNPTVKLDYFWNWGGTAIENRGGSGWAKALDNPSVSVKYKTEIRNKDTGVLITDGNSVPVGTKLILSFLPHVSEDISWFGTGYSGDSPYGEWRDGATPPTMGCNTKDFVIHYHDKGYYTCRSLGTFTIPFDYYFDVYIPLVVAPPTTKTLTNTNGMTCSPLSTTSWECTVTSPGTISPLFTLSATSGKFYYRYWDFRSGVVANRPAGCYGNNIPLKVDTGTFVANNSCTDSTGVSNRTVATTSYSLEVPVQTVSYNFIATAVPPANNPPLPPTITGPTTGTVLTSYIFGIRSTDPDGDTIKYSIDWTNTGSPLQPLPSTGYVASGTTSNTAKSWPTAGTLFTFRARAEDEHGLQSGWTSHSIILTYPPITATCSPSPTSTTIGQPITWTANNVLGGIGNYTYSWSGTDNLTGTTNPLSKAYTTAGTKTASVLITSGTETKTVSCTAATVTAAVNYTLTVTTAGTGGGTTTGAGTYTSGTSVTATATPDTTSTFIGWSGDCNASGQVTMNANKTCIATFTRIPLTVTCSPSPTAVTLNQPVVWTAVASGGIGALSYTWSGSDMSTPVSTASTPTFSKSYLEIGTKTTSVTVTSAIQTATTNCTGSVAVATDLCLNFEGTQTHVPVGFTRDAAGNCICTAPPTTPTGLAATPSTCGNNWLTLSWNASNGATSYQIYRGVTKIYDGPLLTYKDTGLALGSTHSYTITATNAGGTSATSSPAVSGTVSSACPPLPDLPDLTSSVTSPTIATVNIPLTFTANITSANAGTGAPFNTLFQVAREPTGSDAIRISVNSRAALAAGESGLVNSSPHTFTSPGIYYVRACADNDAAFVGVITESDETNNCSSAWTMVTVSPPVLPDLTSSITSPNIATFRTPQAFTANITSANAGTGAPFNTLFQVAREPTGADAIDISVNSRAALAANASGSVTSGTYAFPSAGIYYVRACADNDADFVGVITESNELNNCSSTWTMVTVSNLPDLTARAPDQNTATRGIDRNFTATIINRYAPTGAGFNNFFQVTNNIADLATYTDKPSIGMGALVKGGIGITSTTHRFDTDGIYYVRACADKTDRNNAGVITELNELNNCGPWTTVTVSPPLASYTLTVRKEGTGTGTVSSNPPGINCGSDCGETYTSGTQISLSESHNTGSSFTSWGGDCDSTGHVTMDTNKTCIATFTTPTTFTVTDTDDSECTTSTDNGYNIGCNLVNGISPTTCKNKFESLFNGTTALEVTTYIAWQKGGVNQTPDLQVTCTRTHPASAVYDDITCTVSLPSGQSVSIYQGDYGGGSSFQTISHLTALDTDIPTGTIHPTGSKTFTSPNWSKDDITVAIQCANGGDSTDTCTCAGVDPENWAASNLTDTTIFTHTFGEGILTHKSFYVYDNAGNPTNARSPAEVEVSLGIDKTNPTINSTDILQIGDEVYITAHDDRSGFESYIQAAPFATPFCSTAGKPIRSIPYSRDTTSGPFYAPSGSTLYYCVSDAAGNRIQGIYTPGTAPSYSGCFAEGTMSRVPTLDDYVAPLITRMGLNQYGYSLSDSTRATQNTTFRTRLSQNINTYIKNLYDADAIPLPGFSVTINLNNPNTAATLINSSGTHNTNGYYYYKNLSSSQKYVTLSSTSLGSPKVLLVEGMDVQIDGNITYSSGTNASLVIIARKNGSGVGGNIYVNPGVTWIGATLIADGALMNGEDASPIHWLSANSSRLTNKLTINGRLSTYNTRGGSLTTDGITLDDIGNNDGKCFTGTTFNPLCSYVTAASQDLERFRLTTDTTGQCTLYVSGSNSTVINVLSSLVY